MTNEEIAEEQERVFDELFTIKDILAGDNIDMMNEARKIAVENLRKLTCEEVYHHLYAQFIAKTFNSDMTMEQATRKANIYAIQNTVRVWRKQWQK